MAGKSRKKATANIAIIVVEIIFIILLIVAGYWIWKLTHGKDDASNNAAANAEGGATYETVPIDNGTGKLNVVVNDNISPVDLGISDTVQANGENGGAMSGYLNIALFGIDATSTGISALEKGSRSDTIIIVSVNTNTGDVKLCSVYRDTYLNTGEKSGYQKCNAAYALGGGNVAVSMLNSNLDLNITDWVAISYKGLADAIDCLGGIYIDVDSAEILHINNYQIGISEVLKCDYTPVTETGYQLLNGIQAAAYCRIRYTAGDDFKRAERQREVISAIVDQAKKADADTIVRTFNIVAGNTLTSINSDTFLGLVKNIGKYTIVEEGGFPEASLRTTGNIGAKGSCVVPVNLTSNVIWLHQFLFNDQDYVPSSTVEDISSKIYADTNQYVNN